MDNETRSVNILPKIDRSLSHTPRGGTGMSKRDRYSWADVGSTKGVFQWIAKTDLNIDGTYQREACSDGKVVSIARSWDWLLCGALAVIRRADGTLWVFDGGHRARASFYRDDITHLPCIVHEVASVNEEARAFVARNTMVSNVAATDRYKASVVAEEPIAIDTASILRDAGLVVVAGGAGQGQIACISSLQKCVREDPEQARRALQLCLKIADGSPVVGRVLTGMFTLQMHFWPDVDVIGKFGDKLASHSQKELEIKISRLSAECGKGGSAIFAKALLEVVNHKARAGRLEW